MRALLQRFGFLPKPPPPLRKLSKWELRLIRDRRRIVRKKVFWNHWNEALLIDGSVVRAKNIRVAMNGSLNVVDEQVNEEIAPGVWVAVHTVWEDIDRMTNSLEKPLEQVITRDKYY